MTMDNGAENTDREIWRRVPDDYYSPSIHVTQEGGIGMNVGGRVIVMDIEDWFLCALAKTPWPDYLAKEPLTPDMRPGE